MKKKKTPYVDPLLLPNGQIDELQPFESAERYNWVSNSSDLDIMSNYLSDLHDIYLKHLADPSKTNMNGLLNHIKLAPITSESYDGKDNQHYIDKVGKTMPIRRVNPTSNYDYLLEQQGFLDANKEHTGEEVMNSRGMYNRMTLEEAKQQGYVEVTPKEEEEIKLYMEGEKERDRQTYWHFLEMIHHTAPEVLKEFIEKHYGKENT